MCLHVPYLYPPLYLSLVNRLRKTVINLSVFFNLATIVIKTNPHQLFIGNEHKEYPESEQKFVDHVKCYRFNLMTMKI